MERLTQRLPDGSIKVEHTIYRLDPKTSILGSVIDRLSAYENTGLTPEEIPHWISVEENLPQPESVYLVFIDGVGTELAYFTKIGIWRALDSVYYTGEITHWMPRPLPPKEGK